MAVVDEIDLTEIRVKESGQISRSRKIFFVFSFFFFFVLLVTKVKLPQGTVSSQPHSSLEKKFLIAYVLTATLCFCN